MKIKIRYIVFAALLLLIPCSFLQAQTVKYFLEWQKDQKARRYEVVVEKEEDNEYRQTIREFTETSSIEVSLEPGKYRYMVIPYNFLDRPGKIPDWKEFEVLLVLAPELYDFSPSVFYADTDTVYELTVTAKNLNSETGIYLRHIGGAIDVPDDKKIIVPVEKEFNEDGSVRLIFNNNQLIPGDYEIVAKNPGLKEASKQDFTIAPKEIAKEQQKQTCLGVGMYWPNMGMYWNQFSDKLPFPGFMLHFRTVVYKRNLFNIDYVLKLSWYTLKAGSDDYYFMNDFFTFLMQVWTPNRLIAFGIRPGFGLLFPLSGQKNLNMNLAHFNLDVSVCYILGKHFFLEAGIVGVDFLFMDKNRLYLYPPFLMLGCRF